MKRVFDFFESIEHAFYDKFGFPTIKVFSDFAEIYFDSTAIVHDLSILQLPADEFRMFPSDGRITYVYTIFFFDVD